jgi:signal transduction histidine kinase
MNLRNRIILLVLTSVLVTAAVVGWASWGGLRAMRTEATADRGALAASVARHLDDLLRADLETLQEAALTPAIAAGEGADIDLACGAVRRAYLHSRLVEAVHLLDATGQVCSEPTSGHVREPLSTLSPTIERAWTAGRPTVSGVVGDPIAGARVYLVVPARSWRGTVTSTVAGEIDPARPRFAAIVQALDVGPQSIAEAVDEHGVIVASADRRRIGGTSEAARLAGNTIDRPRSPNEASSSPSDSEWGRDVVAARLTIAPWAIVVSERPAARAAATLLRTRLLLVGPLLLAGGLLFAWGTAWSVRRPLAVLGKGAAAIASGDLDQPLASLGDDEVGRLGRSFETMRVSLRDSYERVEKAKDELEQRVEERTEELQALYRELRERDRARGRLLEKLISAQEDERKRIARELHDETSQTLSALVLKLERTLAAPGGGSPAALVETKALAVRALDEIHRVIYDLRPSVLDDLGLPAAIRWYAERLLTPHGINWRCEFGDLDRRLAPEVEIALFRLVQEAITNIARHARAETVLVQASIEDEVLTIEIEDDGIGFDPVSVTEADARGRGLGLMGMRERVDLLGGTFHLDSSPGAGTVVLLTVPIAVGVVHA